MRRQSLDPERFDEWGLTDVAQPMFLVEEVVTGIKVAVVFDVAANPLALVRIGETGISAGNWKSRFLPARLQFSISIPPLSHF